MKTLITTTVSALALVGMTMSLPASDTTGAVKHIEFTPDQMGFDSMLPNAERVRKATEQELTGTVARLVVYMERKDSLGRPTLESAPREMFIFPTASGRHLVRFSDPWPAYDASPVR